MKIMQSTFRNFKIVIAMLAVAGLIGCAASGMKDVEQSGFLKDYSQLKPGSDDQAALVYIKPDADFGSYNKVMFERIAVVLAPSSESREIDPAILKDLADYYQNALVEAMKGGYEIVDQPGPDVLWVRVAITDVVPSNPTANTMSSIIPIGMQEIPDGFFNAGSEICIGLPAHRSFIQNAGMDKKRTLVNIVTQSL